MLRQRIITAIVLLAVLLPALFYSSPIPFCAVALVLIAAAGWEWGRLNACSQMASILMAFVLAAICGLTWVLGVLEKPLPMLWMLAGGAWVLLGSLLLRGGVSGWAAIARPIRLIGGLAVLWLAWLAVAQARVTGIEYLLSVLVSVWVADIFAYAAGRTLGGRCRTDGCYLGMAGSQRDRWQCCRRQFVCTFMGAARIDGDAAWSGFLGCYECCR